MLRYCRHRIKVDYENEGRAFVIHAPRPSEHPPVRLIRQQLFLELPCTYVFMYVCMYGHTYSKSMDKPGRVANPARGQLNRENEYFPVPVRA